MEINSYTKQWLDYGDSDLSSAEFLQKMNPVPINIVCYHCQQAAEKYLKGYMSHHKLGLAKTHDLRMLCKECLDVNGEFVNVVSQCTRLTTYSTITRYPNEVLIDVSDMNVAINDAKKVGNLVKRLISEEKMKM